MESKINVSLRVKPLSKIEEANEKNHLWGRISDQSIINKRTGEVLTFDKVFGEEVST